MKTINDWDVIKQILYRKVRNSDLVLEGANYIWSHQDSVFSLSAAKLTKYRCFVWVYYITTLFVISKIGGKSIHVSYLKKFEEGILWFHHTLGEAFNKKKITSLFKIFIKISCLKYCILLTWSSYVQCGVSIYNKY